MRKLATFAVCILFASLAYFILPAEAAPKGDMPKASYGVVAVPAYDGGTAAADGGITPIKMFTGMIGRNAFVIYNGGSTTIYCGWNKSVTPLNAFPVPASASLSVDLTYNAAGDTDFYCIAANGADQYTPADTRWIQVK